MDTFAGKIDIGQLQTTEEFEGNGYAAKSSEILSVVCSWSRSTKMLDNVEIILKERPSKRYKYVTMIPQLIV